MLSSGVLGGALSTLAWLAGGNPDGLLQYLPARYDKIPSKRDIGLILEWFPRLAAIPLPTWVQDEWEKIQGEISLEEQLLFPQPSSWFYITIMVLFIVVSFPFCIARAGKDFKKGVLMAISILFMGSQMIFATLMPTLGLRLYWTQITAGYIKVALVNSAAMVVTALFLLSTSSYDNVREKLGCLLQSTGALMSKSASVICSVSDDAKYSGEEKPQGRDEKIQGEVLAELRDSNKIYNLMAQEVRFQAGADDPTATAVKQETERTDAFDNNDDVESLLVGRAPPVVAMTCSAKSAQELYADATAVEHALVSTTFEIPLPGISSQPGSLKAHYDSVLESAVKLINVAGSIDASAKDAYFEINRTLALRGDSPEVAAIVTKGRDAVGVVLASCAAVCSDLSVALRHMPLGSVCYGPQMAWKPKDAAFWADLYSVLTDAATALTPMVAQVAVEEGLEIVEKPYIEGRASLAALANCEMLLKSVQEIEDNAAIALKVQQPKGAKSNIKEKIKNNGYLSSSIVLLVLGLGIPVWIEVVKAMAMLTKGAILLIRSPRRALRQYKITFQTNRGVQFALKFWFAMSVAMVGIILILWKGEGSKKPTLLENIGNQVYFFFVWQPIYFWITAVICTQKQVEATAMRAVLRSTMSAAGGVLGYCTMLNGNLAQNAYFICAIVSVFNGFCGLFAPIKTLRYSLFLAAFTFNAVVACQYFQCGCDLPGDPKVFGGKVLSTVFGSIYAMIVSWLILPYYTSEVMLREEAEALLSGAELIARQDKLMKLKVKKPVTNFNLDNNSVDINAAIDDKNGSLIEEKLREPLARVKAELENNVLDRKQLLLTWNILPTPRVVSILMEKLSNLANYLETAENLGESTLWTGAPGPSQAHLLNDLEPQMATVIAVGKDLATSCSDCMAATSNASVHSTRAAVAETTEELRAARVALRTSFLEWTDAKKEYGSGSAWTATTDYKFLAWVHSMLMAVREVEIIGVVLAETEASLDRDTFVTWASSCYGRRPV